MLFSVQRDKENLAVITDHGVIEKLAKLADTDNDTLRAKLAQAMGNCCEWPGNRALFGGSGAVAPLVNYLGKIFLLNWKKIREWEWQDSFRCPLGGALGFLGNVRIFGGSGAVHLLN